MAIDNAFPTAATALTTMAQWEALYVGGLGGASGVVAGKGGELAPSINSGARTVSIATGSALVRGFYTNNPAATATAVPTASAGDRVDRLVLRLDRTAVTAPNWIKLVIIQGTSGSTTPPAVQASDTGSWDLQICRWTTKADGTLTGLVDERVELGGSFVVFKSTLRPSASPPRLGLESDTQRLLYADGSAWNPIVYDSGWVTVTPTGHWGVGGFTPQVRRRDQTCYLRGSMARTVDILHAGDVNSPMGTLSADFYPLGTHNWGSLTSTPSAGPVRLQVGTAGQLALVDLGTDIPKDRVVYLDTTWLKG